MNRQSESAKYRLARTLFHTVKATMALPAVEGSPHASVEGVRRWIDRTLDELDQETATVLLPLLLDRLQDLEPIRITLVQPNS